MIAWIDKLKRKYSNARFKAAVKKERKAKYLFHNTRTTPGFSVDATKKRILSEFRNLTAKIDREKDQYVIPMLATGAFILLASLYIIFLSPYFRIAASRVIIERTDGLSDVNIAYRSVENVYGSSIFFIDKEAITKQVLTFQKNIKDVEITRLYPNGLKIVLHSFKPQFIANLNIPNKSYVISSNGVLIYQKTPDPKLKTLDVIDPVLLESGLIDYREVATEKTMLTILRIREDMTKLFSDLRVTKFVFFAREHELHVHLESGPIILVSVDESAEKWLAMLRYYVDNQKEFLLDANLVYTDVRNPGKLFYCKDKNLCPKNLARIYGAYYGKK